MGRAPWLAWFGGAVAVAIIAFLIGLTGLFGGRESPPATINLVGAIAAGADGLDCPEGAVVTRLLPGDRVFVVARSSDSTWFAVRSAGESYETVWVAASTVRADDSAGIVGVPVDGCLTPTPIAVTP